jgi:hypothetical protein
MIQWSKKLFFILEKNLEFSVLCNKLYIILLTKFQINIIHKNVQIESKAQGCFLVPLYVHNKISYFSSSW